MIGVLPNWFHKTLKNCFSQKVFHGCKVNVFQKNPKIKLKKAKITIKLDISNYLQALVDLGMRWIKREQKVCWPQRSIKKAKKPT